MQASLVAMLANGFRPSTSEAGHHQLLIQALPKTIALPPDRVRVLDCARRLNLDHLCRLNFDQGSSAVREAGGCG